MTATSNHFRCRSFLAIALTAIVALAAGCGGDASPTGPNFPPPNGGSFGSQSVSAVSGVVLGGGGAALSSEAVGSTPRTSATGGVQVSVQGTGLTTTTDGNGNFILVGVPNGTVVLQFSGPGMNAFLTLNGVGAHTQIQITVQVQDNTATIVNQVVGDLSPFSGQVDSVNEQQISFELEDGTTILVDGNTVWDPLGDLFSFVDLAVQHAAGMTVLVEGFVAETATGESLATSITAQVEPPNVDDLDLRFSRAKWSLGWIDNGSQGQGNSAIEAYIDDGPFMLIDPESIELVGPDGFVVPFATRFDSGERFVARFTKAQVISVAANVVPPTTIEVIVRGTLLDGTPFELTHDIEIVDDDDDDDDDDGGNKIDPAVAEQAIEDIEAVIEYLEGLVEDGDMAANNAKPLITKLEAAIKSLEKLNGIPAVNQLGAFLNQLDAAAKTGKIPGAHAEIIEDLVQDIIDFLESSD